VNILLVAEESAGNRVLRRLASGPHNVVAVLAAPPTTGGGATAGQTAESLGLPLLPSERVREPDFAAWIRDHAVDLLLNVHSLFVICPEVVEAPRIGGFNLHPGPLPRYAGLNAPSWAIYEGETTHAVTLHWLEPGIDTGAIAFEQRFPISEDDTGLSLSARCVREGLPLIDELLATIERGDEIPARPQDLRSRRYFGRRPPQDGRISWSAPAQEIVNFVRAADYSPFPSPWGHPRAWLEPREVGIVRSELTGLPATAPPGTIGKATGGTATVAAADEWVLLKRLLVAGRYVSADSCLAAGHRLDDG
jgi:UDP-4-amino-4-deoxy-L-arabinose formyltransferase/UDP-glucuronic acid dehydrogenase (UDP-4-keto-hexauronic acid decarboxylating)